MTWPMDVVKVLVLLDGEGFLRVAKQFSAKKEHIVFKNSF